MKKDLNKILSINDKYEILENKGKGSSAMVYLAKNKETKKNYAIKVFKDISSDFKNEISFQEKVSLLNIPYLIKLIEYGNGPIRINYEEEEKQYIVLDYASNGELFDYIYCSQNWLKEKYAKLIFGKILKGVQALHKAGICHRDLKLQNILLDEFYNPKICDFGFAAEIQGKDGSGKLYEYLGSKSYAAPELFFKIPYDGIKVDIYSLGIILMNLATSKSPFKQAIMNDKYYKYIMKGNIKKYWKLASKEIREISEELKDLFIKMVSFNPKERPTIDEILKHPWMKEVEDLNEEEYKLLEKEVFKEFENIKNKLKK